MNTNLKAWGLYKAESTQAIPLKHIDISIQIFHNVAKVIYSQEYFNDADLLIETEFFFPISPDACFDSFEATFNNTTIKGVVKEKEKAKEEYKQAVEEGRTAAYSEINQETGDIMKVMIGNIPPNTNIKVTYSYIQKLETSLNKFWCFRLFSTLTPRYNNMSNLQDFLNHDVNVLSSYPTVSKNSSDAYPWTIQAEIHSPSPITFLKSPSHNIKITYGNENHTCNITLDPDTKHFPNKDFVLLFSNGRESKIDYLMTPFEDGYCAMVSLLADFEKSSTEDAFDNFVKAKEIENLHSMSSVRGEYIFLIDRSGSMGGERITMARDSLILFLKSLPKDSYFNVISFGSDYQFLHPESLQYSQQSIDSAINQIQAFQADMGGTEIYRALNQIFSNPPKKGYPRFVFLLTDGAVSNTKSVLDLILAHNDKTRTFTIGIGNGCSPELINKGATYGRGKAEFVTENNQIFEKVVGLLNASLSPCYSELTLHADNFDAVVKSVSPNPSSIPFLINGQTVTFFLFLRSAAFQDSQKMNLKLSMYDSRKQKSQTIDVTLDTAEAFENELIPKLAIHDMIKRLEDQKDKVSKNEEIIWMSKDDLQKAMTEYSLKYGILCKETAFFCEISDNQTNTMNVVPTKIVVPTTLSQDYEDDSFGTAHRSSHLKKKKNSRLAGPKTQNELIALGLALQESSLQSLSSTLAKVNDCSQIAEKTLMELDCQREILQKSIDKCNTVERSNSGIVSGLKKGISNAVNSLASKFTSSEKSVSQTDQIVFAKSASSNRQGQGSQAIISDASSALHAESKTKSSSNNSYLNIIMKQKFEGYWDPSDNSLKQAIFKDGILPQLPSDLHLNNSTQAEAVWITILVMRWLEVVCKDDRKAWLLVYQKAYEWLETQGVKYDEVKDLASSNLHTK